MGGIDLKRNISCVSFAASSTHPGGGGAGRGTPLYKPYRYVPPQRARFLRRFGLKTGLDFAYFGLE